MACALPQSGLDLLMRVPQKDINPGRSRDGCTPAAMRCHRRYPAVDHDHHSSHPCDAFEVTEGRMSLFHPRLPGLKSPMARLATRGEPRVHHLPMIHGLPTEACRSCIYLSTQRGRSIHFRQTAMRRPPRHARLGTRCHVAVVARRILETDRQKAVEPSSCHPNVLPLERAAPNAFFKH